MWDRREDEKRALQAAICIASLVPLLAGGAGALVGAGLVGESVDVSLDSHLRYLSGLLLGIGIAFVAMVPRIERHGPAVRLLAGIVAVGGLARLFGLAAGLPDVPMRLALVMELVVTPGLALWQARLARRYIA